ncbi:glycerophosphodiester phosphodiesterase family protein [Polaribacter gangjinensis]|uniref:PKD domain-containing protein n=1 Tax=Polaribacter gangjinensis TaxID=574710 RepID=A0A2S7WAF1_9FLAO|nr:glycerophosphodiester phosphodiesterase family protein [Polaribacter gangjinensis]PQJ74610.1 hypothetical protein BTO13_04775 [Polaribacter gangjinensis]
MKEIILNIVKQSKVFVFLLLVACSADETIVNPGTVTVSFSVNSEDIFAGESVQFTNTSTGTIDAVNWDFGDGNSSNQQNPSHSFTTVGNYIVKLTITSSGQQKSVSKELAVSISSDINGRVTLKDKLNSLNGKMMVCAHRAIAIDKPENSLSAIQSSIDNAIEMIEIDIRQTKDGQLVLMHDATIQRTTNGTGDVSNFTLQELQQFNLEKSNGTLTNEKIPTLKEVFTKTRGKIYINLDIDNKAPFTKVYDLAKQYGMLKQVQFYTKDNNLIRSMIAKDATIVVLPFIDNETQFNAYNTTNLTTIHYSENSFNATLIDKAKEKGWAVYANVYVNTSVTPQSNNNQLIDRFIFLKGSVVQTDHPAYIKNYLQQKNLN